MSVLIEPLFKLWKQICFRAFIFFEG